MPPCRSERDTPHVAAVVLNWNGGDKTLACLESLSRSDWPRLTPIVVDNASEEDIEPQVVDRFERALFIRNSSNLGFGGGMNVGIDRAMAEGADFVLLLNNDTVVSPEMVRKLVTAADERPRCGIVSPLDLFRSAPTTIASAGLRCDLRRGYQGPPLHQGEQDTGQLRGLGEVDASSGTAMLVPASAIEDVGPLDDSLFLYIEDVDWSLRMRAAGRGVYVAYDAKLWHEGSASSGGERTPVVSYYHARNSFVVTRRHLPLRGLRRAARHLEIVLVNLGRALRGPRPVANSTAVLAGWRDYLLGRLGPRVR